MRPHASPAASPPIPRPASRVRIRLAVLSTLGWGLAAWIPYVGWPYVVLGRRVPDAGPGLLTLALVALSVPAGACFFLGTRPARDWIGAAPRGIAAAVALVAGIASMALTLVLLALGDARSSPWLTSPVRLAVVLLCACVVPRLVWAGARRLPWR